MLFLRACPRCRGDVVEQSDVYGPYYECLQCGWLRDRPKTDEFEARLGGAAVRQRKDGRINDHARR